MQTDIHFLRELEQDLLEAAWRESVGREPATGRPRRARPRGGPRRRLALVSAGTLLSLVAAGAIGFFATRDGSPLPGGAADEQRRSVTARLQGGRDSSATADATADLSFENAGENEALGGFDPSIGGTTLPGDLARVIKTAQVSVVVGRDTFADAFELASGVAARYGGFVQSSSTDGGRSGRLVMRVEAARFDAALSELRDLGRVESEAIDGEDVTAQYVDLRGRLRILEARLVVLLRLMDQATTIESTLRVENALEDVQFRIEEIRGRLRLLNNQTDKATIQLNLRETGVSLAVEKVAKPSLGSAWDHSIAGFFRVIFAVVVGLGYLVPVAVVGLAVWLVVRRARRRATA
ncbi:MAG: DUF4349 domain-containing protein, partial [Actinomycetota bacterium]